MFCARCGQQIPDATVICPLCGRASTIEVQLLPARESAAPGPARIPTTEVAIDGPQGVGGWLQFFCVVITVLSPISVFIRLEALGPAGLFSRVTIVEMVRIVYGMIVGIFLWARSPQALMLLRIYFGLTGLVVLLRVLSLISVNMRVGWDAALLIADLTPLLPVIGYTLLWFAYFHKSKRVRNTYGGNL